MGVQGYNNSLTAYRKISRDGSLSIQTRIGFNWVGLPTHSIHCGGNLNGPWGQWVPPHPKRKDETTQGVEHQKTHPRRPKRQPAWQKKSNKADTYLDLGSIRQHRMAEPSIVGYSY